MEIVCSPWATTAIVINVIVKYDTLHKERLLIS